MNRYYQNQLFADRRTSFSQRSLGKACIAMRKSFLRLRKSSKPKSLIRLIAPRHQERKETSSNRREQRKRSFLIHLCYLRYLL
jgi:hypothetical protein